MVKLLTTADCLFFTNALFKKSATTAQKTGTVLAGLVVSAYLPAFIMKNMSVLNSLFLPMSATAVTTAANVP